MLLDAIRSCPIDSRRELANNLVLGRSCQALYSRSRKTEIEIRYLSNIMCVLYHFNVSSSVWVWVAQDGATCRSLISHITVDEFSVHWTIIVVFLFHSFISLTVHYEPRKSNVRKM